jgi:septum formation protein
MLLASVGLPVVVRGVAVDESPKPGESGSALSRRLARRKATLVAARFPGRTVLGADTVVVVRGRILGKPRDFSEARAMLATLSGGWHEVVTSVALVAPDGRLLTAQAMTRVRLARLTFADIARYAASREPYDKAGAYALQGAAGWFVEEIRGSASNVIGLPLEKVRRLLTRAGLPAPALRPRGLS